MAERIMAAPRELVVGRGPPRETYDEATLAELAESIREHGVIADLLAIVNEYGELELIAGHRRKRAALAAGGRDVPVKVLEVTAAQAFELAIIDNDQRSDLTDLERGKAYERIIAEQQISEAELARRLGRARAYIQQRRKLAQACPELQQAYIGGQLGFTHVRAICDGSGGDHAVQQAVVAYEIKEIKAGRPDTATSLQERAERTVREQSGAALRKLGWKVDQYWQGNTQRHYHHAPTARPAEWSSAEILAAVREQRRPPDGATAAHLDGAARLDLERHGWRMSATACAPWTIAEKGKELIVGDAGDLAPQIAAAREALQKLADRFVKAGWAATWNHTTLTATPPEGGGS
jgi:ParB family chromosome partitioning protein